MLLRPHATRKSFSFLFYMYCLGCQNGTTATKSTVYNLTTRPDPEPDEIPLRGALMTASSQAKK